MAKHVDWRSVDWGNSSLQPLDRRVATDGGTVVTRHSLKAAHMSRQRHDRCCISHQLALISLIRRIDDGGLGVGVRLSRSEMIL